MIVGVIPARRGSEGIPGKNMVDLGGRPLLDYTFSSAERCRKLDRIVLSTNMPDAIDWARRHYGRIEAPFVRPENLADASSSSVDVALHAIDFLEAQQPARIDTVVLLQPTCPFRHAEEIDAAITLFNEKNLSALIGVSRVWHHPSDYIRRREPGKADGFKYLFRSPPWVRRQDFPEVLFITGALYICKAEYLRNARRFCDEESYCYEMSEETMVDIDTPFDLAIARGLVATGLIAPPRPESLK
jgi:CMP-N,N'-diacetyllegionaminic acid synthase